MFGVSLIIGSKEVLLLKLPELVTILFLIVATCDRPSSYKKAKQLLLYVTPNRFRFSSLMIDGIEF